MNGATSTARLARFAIETPAEAMPAAAFNVARTGVVDTIGCALGALDEPAVRIACASVSPTVSGRTATILGAPRRYAMGDAAFVNAIASHVLDFDDNMPTLRGHPSTTVLPAALAAAEAVGASGRDLLAAYVMGVEVAGKLGLTMGAGHYMRGWHPTATVAIYGATAAAARLLGLDAGQLEMAWAIAASQVSGLRVNFGTMTKAFNAGHAARCALQAATLAEAGFTAAQAVFDGPNSAIATYGSDDGTALAPLLDHLGAPWEMQSPGLYVKRWPCCYCSHRPIAGLLELAAAHRIEAREIQEIAIGFPPGTDAGLIKGEPQTGLAGKFSIAYTAAAALLDGDVTLATFSDAELRRTDAQVLMRKVTVYPIEDKQRYSATVGYNDVAIVTERGRFEMRVNDTPGSPTSPLSHAEIDAKFIGCASLTLRPEDAARALAAAQGLASATRIRPELIHPLSRAAGAAASFGTSGREERVAGR